MANKSDGDAIEAIGGLIGIAIIIAAVIFVIYITLWVVGIFLGIGALVGTGHALYNYQQAFASNVHTES